jgi:hypothetical protein
MMGAIGQICGADNLASIIDRASGAVIATESSDIGEYTAFPDIGMVGEIACETRRNRLPDLGY